VPLLAELRADREKQPSGPRAELPTMTGVCGSTWR
jgi:hypothetical protein